MDEQEQKQGKKRRGCLFYGCLTGIVFLLLMLLALLLGGRTLKRMLTDFTEAQPTTFPAVKLSNAEVQQLRKRVDDFREAVRAGKATNALELNADEMNALIATDPDMQPLKGKLYVSGIEGNQVKARLSIPMEDLNLPVFRNRYLNGDATFLLALKNGIIRLTAQEVTVKGRPVPDIYMQKIRGQNLAKSVNSNPRVSVALDWIQRIDVKDGKLVIVPKQNGP
jgi:hypothetical protein